MKDNEELIKWNKQSEKDLAEKALNDFDNSINKKYGCNAGIKKNERRS